MKKLILFYLFISASSFLFAQDSTVKRSSSRDDRREEKRMKRDAIIKQEEEGVLAYRKQSVFGIQLRTNGYGVFYELGRPKSPRFTNLYLIELTEIKHPKEDKITSSDGIFSNSYTIGKINNFYQVKLGFGQQYIFGHKGNKNGVAIMGIYQAGLSVGLLRPYYLDINENGTQRAIKYDSKDSTAFLFGNTIGSSGFGKGWNELKMKPGIFVKTALRFDFGRYNEMVQALQIGISAEAYSQKIPQLVYNKQKQLFFQGHIAFVFGRRK
ncbi:MAG: hypothetical protein M3352_09975 [Bacteroidota bacterium]|nr:hypothetical protein [Bacteroidota bacterium]